MKRGPKFAGTFSQLDSLVAATGLAGSWEAIPYGSQFRCRSGAILNFWPSTGTIGIQGPLRAAAEFKIAIQNVLSDRRNWPSLDVGWADNQSCPARRIADHNRARMRTGRWRMPWCRPGLSEREGAATMSEYGSKSLKDAAGVLARLHANNRAYFETVLEQSECEPGSPEADGMHALSGISDPLPRLSAAALPGLDIMAAELLRSLQVLRSECPALEIALVFVADRSWSSTSRRPEVDLPQIRQLKLAFRRAAPFSVAVTQIGHLTSSEHQDGRLIQPMVAAVLAGENIGKSTEAELARLERALDSPFEGSPATRIRRVCGFDRLLAATAATLFDIGDPFLREAQLWGHGQGGTAGNARARKRAFRRFPILALTPIARSVFASGEGELALKHMRAKAERAIKAASKASRKPVHEDEVARFLWDQAVRRIDKRRWRKLADVKRGKARPSLGRAP